MLKTFLLASILFLICASPASALPGERAEDLSRWYDKQTFFPTDSVNSFYEGFSLIKPLTQGRKLGYWVVWDSEGISSWEEIKVFRGDEAAQECSSFFLKDGLNFSQEICYQGLSVNLIGPEQPQAITVLKEIYGELAPVISDFKQARLAWEGKLHYGWKDVSHELRQQLLNGPVPVRIYHGRRFLYLTSPFVIYVVNPANKNFMVTIEEFAREDAALHQKLQQQQQQREIDQDRSIPYEL